MKLEKGKHTHRICDINKRHRTAVSFAHLATITCIAEDSFKVSSESRNGTYYTVLKVQSQCHCRLKCQFCSACAHQYTCTCLDACTNTTVCKHIHLVHMREKTIDSTVNHVATADLRYYSTITAPLSISESQEGPPKLPPSRDVLLSNLQKTTTDILTQCSKCCDTNAIERAYNTLEYVLKDLTYCHSGLSTNRKRKASQMKNSIQPRFFSTRKKRKVPTTVLDKPSYDNVDKIQTVLEATETEICSICFHEDDKTGTEACVNWVACNKCHTWVHTAYAKTCKINNEYVCDYCVH